jgi:hypothetical protein
VALKDALITNRTDTWSLMLVLFFNAFMLGRTQVCRLAAGPIAEYHSYILYSEQPLFSEGLFMSGRTSAR